MLMAAQMPINISLPQANIHLPVMVICLYVLLKHNHGLLFQILQIVSSSNCVDLLKLFEKHKKTARQWDSKHLDEYLSEARSLISNDDNFYLVKTLKASICLLRSEKK